MVGHPKSLSDLNRIDASLQVTCRVCGHRREFDVHWLEGELIRRRRNTAWSELPRSLPCPAPGCGSTDMRLLPVAFGAAPASGASVSRRDRILIELAVRVLASARDRAVAQQVATDEVRLALRVLLPWCPQRWPLLAFWQGASAGHAIGRSQAVNAAFNGIMRQLGAAAPKLD